jgi:hypothetical protein
MERCSRRGRSPQPTVIAVEWQTPDTRVPLCASLSQRSACLVCSAPSAPAPRQSPRRGISLRGRGRGSGLILARIAFRVLMYFQHETIMFMARSYSVAGRLLYQSRAAHPSREEATRTALAQRRKAKGVSTSRAVMVGGKWCDLHSDIRYPPAPRDRAGGSS